MNNQPHCPSNPTNYNNNYQQYQQQQQQQQNQYQLNPQQHQQPIKQLHQLPVNQSQQSDIDEDILEKIDSLLLQNQSQSNNQNQHNKYQQRQMLLNFKITQLQKIINNLNQANRKLKNQLQQYSVMMEQQPNNKNNQSQSNNSNNNILNSSTSQTPFTDQLTLMQGQFQQIQHLITEYKQQLAASQKKWNAIKQQKDQQIDSLKSQLLLISQNKDLIEGEMQKIIQENQMLKAKNQQLLIDIQNLQIDIDNNNRRQQQQQNYIQPSHQYIPQAQQQPSSPRYYQTSRKFDQFQDYRFNQKIQRQMQSMIKKLLKQLSNQRKINTRMSSQIKRLNNQVIQLQRKIKIKNDAIYQLEMKIIHMEKQFSRNLNTYATSNNASIVNINKHNAYIASRNTPLTPAQNKKQSRVFTNKYESRTNPQQQKLKPKEENNMRQYQGNQYTDQSDRNNYDDYVVTSIPLKGSRSPPKTNSQQYNNLINSPQSNNMNNIQQSSKFPQSHSFIKPKKLQQSKSKNTNNNAFIYQHRSSQNDKSLNRQFMAFTLMQLQQGKIKITMKQKIIIMSKLIELYCKKIRTQNHQNLSAQEIQVYNFNDKHPNLVRIRVVNSTVSKTDISTGVHEQNEESLMYNLAFIVESLVKDVQTIDRQDLQVDLNLSDIIEEILNKNMQQKIAYFQQLSKSLQNSVLKLV